ncbi:chemotaxis protein CheA [Schlesneria paludicola]|uniref:chemotaxis protein CheA n=1 Tax=Schlesneria paludicola TaxID=360056 RepID=UPI00029A8A93|nr:chemotaxis protein CheA [Schlesneria paludicola]
MDLLDDIVKEFLIESYENLDRLDQDLMALEEVPDDRNRLSSVFRAIHTIKGTSGFLAFNKLEHVTHVGESLLVMLRDGKIRLNNVIANGLLAMVDAVRKIMASIESGQGEGDTDYTELVATLEHLQVTGGLEAPPAEAETPMEIQRATQVLEMIAQQVETMSDAELAPAASKQDATPAKKARATTRRRKKSAKQDDVATNTAVMEMPATSARAFEAIPALHETHGSSATTQRPSILSEADVHVTNEGVHHDLNHDTVARSIPSNEGDGLEKGQPSSVSDSTIRIDVTLLDRLMNLVGELVLARNQILQYSRSTEDASLIAASQRLNLITTELQEGVMKTRMQPIQNVWAKLPRVVRDLSMTCKKKVQVKMEGADTELDKTILEAIRDPLTHIVRNSVDHGIESPEVREAKGKPAEGTLLLRAFHEGGQVNIEISDDGGGINLARVKEKGIGQGLITAEQAAAMSDRELMNLILLPGFSTAAAVTNVSGRGVGMDVVKTNVEKIGGTLDIHSDFGEGTTLRIKIPLTLAIVPALMVTADKERYAIPQNSLVELVRLEGDRARKDIEHIHDAPVYRLRGNLLPLLYLDEQLQLRPARSGVELSQESVVNIVVLNAEDRQFGLVVDEINDTEEIVVKPLGPHLKEITSYAGVTIMGDGTVSLILDVLGIAKRANIVTASRDRHKSQATAKEPTADSLKHTLLLLGLGETQRMAIPLSLVSRLEELPTRSIEWADGKQVVQYSGQIMPLIHLGESLMIGHTSDPTLENLQVVVYSENGRSVGLVVDRILDIVETTLTIQQTGKRPGVLGSSVIQNRVTDVLDIHNLILASDQDFFTPPPTTLAI